MNSALLAEMNRIKKKMEEMSDEEREKYVNSVIDWIVKMFEDISNAMSNGGALKAAKVAKRYKDELKDVSKRASVIVCLTYAIKEKYQKKLSPIFVGLMGLI